MPVCIAMFSHVLRKKTGLFVRKTAEPDDIFFVGQ